ncbi:MAG: hypothetical protein IIX72_04385, partial [Oscillospiraceae bacterium]|nr:hypothetical protein [Oscillospiraceae bacterium]
GAVLKLLYTVGGDGFNWYSFAQYAVLFLGFSAITWVLLRRFRLFPALVMTALIFGAVGTDAYLSMNFSKPAGIATVGAMALIFHGMEGERISKLPVFLGIVLGILGFVWRFEEFGISALLMAGVCIIPVYSRLFEGKELRLGQRIKSAFSYLVPFITLAALAVGLFCVNSVAWNRDEIKDYYKFDQNRSLLIDFYIPDYNEMPEVYDELEMDENFVYMMKKWSFYDTEKFSLENVKKLISVRDDFVPRKTMGECLGVFLNECLGGFLLERPIGAFVFMLVLWLACGKRGVKEWLSLIYMGGMFFVIYMFMIWSERYLANRVDIGMFLAMAVALSFMLDREKLKDEKLLLTAVLCMSLFISYRSSRSTLVFDEHNTIEDKSAAKAAIERVLEDDENLYFVKVWSIDHEMYGPLECAPAGYADKLVHIGGWSMHHPVIVDILDSYEITNPYKDIVNHPNCYIIDEDIERTVAYISKYYYPNAKAELVEPLSDETYLKIYKITA